MMQHKPPQRRTTTNRQRHTTQSAAAQNPRPIRRAPHQGSHQSTQRRQTSDRQTAAPRRQTRNAQAATPRRRHKRKPRLLPRAICVFGSFSAVIALLFLTLTIREELANSTGAQDNSAQLAEMLFAQEMLANPMMILVSVDNLMPDDYVVDEVLADSTTGKTLDAEAAYAYMDMAAAAANDGITFYLQSAYRSATYQEGLFAAQIEKWIALGYSEEDATIQAATVVNPPGASEHNCGLAADINCPDFWELEEGFEETTAFAWLEEHAVEYGYILRYPKEDQETTGITYEPWHWRYVGVQNAAIIKESGLCLEDFLTELALVANGTSTSDAITGTATFQTAVYGSEAEHSNASTSDDMAD